jgi:SAM-dependent methyltransferase
MTPLIDRHVMRRIRNRLGLPLSEHRDFERLLSGQTGLEVGGPSNFFLRTLPLYRVAHAVDQLNFSAETVWSRSTSAHRFDSSPALQRGLTITCDGTDLSSVSTGSYDFLLSCHNLEHIANPLKALLEWTRVVRSAGHVLLIVPNKTGNFDHRRPDTAFEHVLTDFDNQADERDLTHLDEILALHDLDRDREAGTPEQFEARSLLNFENRCLHHHVFSLTLVFAMFRYVGLRVTLHCTTPAEFIVVGEKA